MFDALGRRTKAPPPKPLAVILYYVTLCYVMFYFILSYFVTKVKQTTLNINHTALIFTMLFPVEMNTCSISSHLFLPRDRSLSAQPISIRKAQSRKKAHKPLRTSWISQKMCPPCLIIIQSCYCDYRINETFRMFSPLNLFLVLFTWPQRSTRAKDYRIF